MLAYVEVCLGKYWYVGVCWGILRNVGLGLGILLKYVFDMLSLVTV